MIRVLSGVVICLGGTAITISTAQREEYVPALFGIVVSLIGLYMILTGRRR